MELEEYLKQDIMKFLEEEEARQHTQERTQPIRATDAEFGLFVQRDYAKEMDAALEVNNRDLAKKIFIDAEEAYEKAPEGSNEKEALKKILEELSLKIRLFVSNEKFKRNLSDLVNEFENKGVFTKSFLNSTKKYLHYNVHKEVLDEDDGIKALREILNGNIKEEHFEALKKEPKFEEGAGVEKKSPAKTEKSESSKKAETEVREEINGPAEVHNTNIFVIKDEKGSVAESLFPKKIEKQEVIVQTQPAQQVTQQPINANVTIDIEALKKQIKEEISEELRAKEEEIKRLKEEKEKLERLKKREEKEEEKEVVKKEEPKEFKEMIKKVEKETKEEEKRKEEEIKKLREEKERLEREKEELLKKAKEEALKEFLKREEERKRKEEERKKKEEEERQKKEKEKRKAIRELRLKEAKVREELRKNKLVEAIKTYKEMRRKINEIINEGEIALLWIDKMRELYEDIKTKKEELKILKEEKEHKIKILKERISIRVKEGVDDIKELLAKQKIHEAQLTYKRLKELYKKYPGKKEDLKQDLLQAYSEITHQKNHLLQRKRNLAKGEA